MVRDDRDETDATAEINEAVAKKEPGSMSQEVSSQTVRMTARRRKRVVREWLRMSRQLRRARLWLRGPQGGQEMACMMGIKNQATQSPTPRIRRIERRIRLRVERVSGRTEGPLMTLAPDP